MLLFDLVEGDLQCLELRVLLVGHEQLLVDVYTRIEGVLRSPRSAGRDAAASRERDRPEDNIVGPAWHRHALHDLHCGDNHRRVIKCTRFHDVNQHARSSSGDSALHASQRHVGLKWPFLRNEPEAPELPGDALLKEGEVAPFLPDADPDDARSDAVGEKAYPRIGE